MITGLRLLRLVWPEASRVRLVMMEIYTDVPDQATQDALGQLSGWLDQADEPPPPPLREPTRSAGTAGERGEWLID
jgi:hypothetical protein